MGTGTVRTKIMISFSAVVILMVALCGFAYVQLRSIESLAVNLRDDAVPGLVLIAQVHAVSVSEDAAVQQHVREKDSAKMAAILVSIQQKTAERQQFLKAFESLPLLAKEKELHQVTESALSPYMAVRSEVLRLSADPRTKSQADALFNGQQAAAYRTLQDAIDAEYAFQREQAVESAGAIQQAVARSELGMVISLGVAFLLAVGAGYALVQAVNRPLLKLVAAVEAIRAGDFTPFAASAEAGEFSQLSAGLGKVTGAMRSIATVAQEVADGNLSVEVDSFFERDGIAKSLAEMVDKLSTLIRRVQKAGLQVNTSATEIAATSQEQLSTASEVAATTSEIAATSKEISATSKELVQTIRQIAEVADKTTRLASNGQAGLTRMKLTMEQIMESSASMNSRLGALSEKAGNIGTVVTTITKVADQTNLLSLNAAIEAEKAGDYGRGFSVVATEIRRMADQTAAATGDIEQMVKEVQTAVAASVMGMDKFSEGIRQGADVVGQVGEELTEIIHHVQALTPNFESVSEGMQSQSLGAQQISDGLSQLGEASRQTVEALRQSNQAIEQLNEAARALQDGVVRFKVKA